MFKRISKNAFENSIHISKRFLNISCLVFFMCFFAFVINKIYLLRIFKFTQFSPAEQFQILISSLFANISFSCFISFFTSCILFFIYALHKLIPFRFLKIIVRFFSQSVHVVLISILFLLMVSHVEYMRFFGETIRRAHLHYLMESRFVGATLQGLLSPSLFFMILTVIIFVSVLYFLLWNRIFSRRFYTVFLTLLCLSPILYASKNIYNSKNNPWIAKKLLNTFLERLVNEFWRGAGASLATIDEDLIVTSEDISSLMKWKNESVSHDGELLYQDFWKRILEQNYKGASSPLGVHLKNSIQTRLKNHQQTYIWVMLLESFRPIDGQFFYPENPHSYEPFYDSLASTGISFMNAWSVGTTTHAGQEGAYCGLWAGTFNKVMLTNTSRINCLTDYVFQHPEWNAESEFYYGGPAHFDNKTKFWKQHHLKMMSEEIFPKEAVRTSWGVSDRELFHYVEKSLEEKQNKDLHIKMLLTLTNHHNYEVPKDAQISEFEFKKSYSHLKTVAYTDSALKEWVSKLKSIRLNSEESVWDASFIFFMNDHGVGEPSYRSEVGAFHISPEEDLDFADRRTRLGLVMHGGLVQKTLKETGHENGKVLQHVTSQADVYATVLDFINVSDGRTLSDSLFAESRRWPVFADLGDHVLIPNPHRLGDGLLIKREDLIRNRFVFDQENSPLYEYYKTAFHLFRVNQKLIQNKRIGL